ncbi:MAG: ribonuclease III [Wolbachia endosymbiont of Fragariocoptes setiger]|nr:ribonuclease III [Wolbachia endosymbiont of Fragariocoptes setiger]
MLSLNESIFKIINYRFINNNLLIEALTHPSINKRNSNNKIISYERLEFLGDSILNMVISAMLFRLFPDEKEGALAKRKTDLVCGNTIANIAKEIQLSDFIIMSNSEICNGGKYNLKNLENVLEALIGALYIDGGLEVVEEFIFKHWKKLANTILNPPQDCKTTLQEWAQKNGLPLPEYKVIEKTGPAHKPEFTISISIEHYGRVTASAYNKKLAEQKAAELILEKIKSFTST